ncbi:hypothetical protein GUITHDRAFT_134639 [Guillardia theta CCMP2712]|uniref:EF-hand domain-containing protein n=1 Tax=Guillardia theta (strain CCMP2712) TaxID=905079 RepID=L1JSQ8_GUITC|nr:hypothetical protein GUITHDRAFT_134639 [Guillardia theta CCMP2712]EKX51123.1 hypothetical protein GUITHDRAFT_134639 [Guillardia theta CCMP2712]|eukprot:XP_005838103.1 hypothetical protein GUITHDRAFT_134639 [Guillardia theta CCMP2712]
MAEGRSIMERLRKSTKVGSIRRDDAMIREALNKLKDDGDLIDIPPPLKSEIVHESPVQMTDFLRNYVPKYVFLTEDDLMIGNSDGTVVNHIISLNDITRIRHSNVDEFLERRAEYSNTFEEECLSDFDDAVLEVVTAMFSNSFGRSFSFKFQDKSECKTWIKEMQSLRKKALIKAHVKGTSRIRTLQYHLKLFYDSDFLQYLVALFIFLNFLTNVLQSEISPTTDNSKTAALFDNLDLCFTVIFTVELVVNMTANWFKPFFESGWNFFDLTVVGVSLVALFLNDVPGLSHLRLMRAFRVVRLFGRLASLRQIINALTASILPVFNAYIIMLLVTSIYAIVGVTFFSQTSPEKFGTFSLALFTMFQVATGDGWASDISRPLIFQDNPNSILPDVNIASSFFFVSFVVIVGWSLLQVVVAVMLDNFTAAADKEKKKIFQEQEYKHGEPFSLHALDPVLESLSAHSSTEQLTSRIASLFAAIDDNGNGTLSFPELRQGFQKFPLLPKITLSRDDFDEITCNGMMCNEDGEVTEDGFQGIMRMQLALYLQRQLANAIHLAEVNDSENLMIMKTLKIMSLMINDLGSQMSLLNPHGNIYNLKKIEEERKRQWNKEGLHGDHDELLVGKLHRNGDVGAGEHGINGDGGAGAGAGAGGEKKFEHSMSDGQRLKEQAKEERERMMSSEVEGDLRDRLARIEGKLEKVDRIEAMLERLLAAQSSSSLLFPPTTRQAGSREVRRSSDVPVSRGDVSYYNV